MTVLATILTVFAALVAGFHAASDRWPKNGAPSAGRLSTLRCLLLAGLAAGFAFAVLALGWIAGSALWAVAIMVMGVAVVSLVSVQPLLTRRLGIAAGIGGLLLGLVPMLPAWS